MISYFVHMYSLSSFQSQTECTSYATREGIWIENVDGMGCIFSHSVIWWLEKFAVVTIEGMILVGLGSVGNCVGSPIYKPFIAACLVACWFFVQLYGYRQLNWAHQFLVCVILILAFLTAILHTNHIGHFRS